MTDISFIPRKFKNTETHENVDFETVINDT